MREQVRGCAFLGASIHTCLGEGIEANLAALRQAPEPPALHDNARTDEVLQIPYKLLDNTVSEKQDDLYAAVTHIAEQALDEARITAPQRRRMGLFVGSSSFDLAVWEARFVRELEELPQAIALRNGCIAVLADEMVQRLDLRGADYSFNTACTASANALIAADAQIRAGLIDHALVLGVEFFNEVSALGFHGLGLLTRSVMLPFDESRDGLVLGEGVSALVLGPPASSADHFQLVAGANFSDTHSISGVTPDGSTIARVMQTALDRANLTPEQIAGLKVHGTASLSNDEAESAGMHRVFAQLPPLSALKPYIGHTLGACGLNELVLYYRALEAGFLIATPGISAQGGDLNVTLNQASTTAPPGYFMLNSFGFGGNNTSLIIGNRRS